MCVLCSCVLSNWERSLTLYNTYYTIALWPIALAHSNCVKGQQKIGRSCYFFTYTSFKHDKIVFIVLFAIIYVLRPGWFNHICLQHSWYSNKPRIQIWGKHISSDVGFKKLLAFQFSVAFFLLVEKHQINTEK